MTACFICNTNAEYFLGKDGFSYQKCPSCGLVFVHPQPTEEYLSKEVYSQKAGYQKHRKNVATKENRHIKKILDYLSSKLVKGKILDVGCSNGDFLYYARQRGFEPYGVEINELTAQVAKSRGLNIKQGTLTDAAYPDDFFDAIFLGDIIEHVLNPRALLVECRRILKPKGILIISTPNLDSFWARATFKLYEWFNIPWSVLTPPHHLFQFSENNLKRFLKNNGFVSSAVWFRRPPSLLYELGNLHLWKKWKEDKTGKHFFFMVFAFAAYTKLYLFDIFMGLFKKKNFGMIVVCERAGGKYEK